MNKDDLGDRMKEYEKRYGNITLLPSAPIMARLDGRRFSKFTTDLKKPYDIRLSQLMIDVTKFLVEQTNARCGYTQSDEITLVWHGDNVFFKRKLLKINSVASSLCTGYFNKLLPTRIPEKAQALPVFDCRVWELPTQIEAANCFVWRELDATRNSIQGAARNHYDHSDCHNKNTSQLLKMLLNLGIDWNDYPSFFKKGTYVRQKTIEQPFPADQIPHLPPKHEARINPNLTISRTILVTEELPPLAKIKNKVQVIMNGSDPILEDIE